MIRKVGVFGVTGLLVVALLPPTRTMGANHASPDLAIGKATFAQCSACHSLAKGGAGIGPTMFGLVGRKIGGVPGFAYSSALKAKPGVWTPAALDAYVTDPKTAVPGNRMPYPGLKDPAKRASLVAFLKTIK